jgi:hypothetical protein
LQPAAGLVLVENQVASAAVTNSIVVAENQVASAAMGRNLTERDEETSSTKWHAQFWSQTTLLLLLLLSLSLSLSLSLMEQLKKIDLCTQNMRRRRCTALKVTDVGIKTR